MLRTFLAALVAAALTISATDAQADDNANAVKRMVDKSLSTHGNPVVRITGFAGDIHVRPADGQMVAVHATLSARDAGGLDQMHVEVDQQVGDVTIAAPAGHVRVAERVGDITITHVVGPVFASVTTGDVSISLAPEWNGASIDASAAIGDVTGF